MSDISNILLLRVAKGGRFLTRELHSVNPNMCIFERRPPADQFSQWLKLGRLQSSQPYMTAKTNDSSSIKHRCRRSPDYEPLIVHPRENTPQIDTMTETAQETNVLPEVSQAMHSTNSFG